MYSYITYSTRRQGASAGNTSRAQSLNCLTMYNVIYLNFRCVPHVYHILILI